MAPVHTFSWQEVDQHSHGGDEDTGHNDVDDVEEWLALDDEVEDDLLVLDIIWGELLRIDDLPSRAVLDGPFTILCQCHMNAITPLGALGLPGPQCGGGKEGEGW